MKKILIIEDDVFLGDVLTQKLTNEGYQAVLARDGLEGYQKIKSLMPDLILVDNIMPNKNVRFINHGPTQGRPLQIDG